MTINPLTSLHRFAAMWASPTDATNELLFSADDISEYVLSQSYIGHGLFNVIDPAYGAIGNGIADDRAAFVAAQTACGNAGTLVVPAGTYRIGSSLTLTSPVFFQKGAVITAATGVTVTFSAPVMCQTLGRVFNTSGGGLIAASAGAFREVTPQMFGAAADGVTDDSQPMQAMFDCAFGPSTAPHGTTDGANLKVYIPPGKYSVDAVKLYKIYGFHIEGAGRQTTTILNRADRCAWDMNCVSYGEISGIQFLAGHATTDAAVVELDGTFSDALKPQQLTFRSCTFHGNAIAQRGYRFGLNGTSAAQGDTILFDNCLGVSCLTAGFDIIGSNALAHTFVGGNIQQCNHDGIAVHGGQAIVYGMSFQNQFDSNKQVRMKGADVNVYGATSPCRLHGVRTESPTLARGLATLVDNEIYAAGFFPWAASAGYSTGDIIVGTSGVSTADGRAWRAIVADVTSYAAADTTGDLSHIDDHTASWTVNQYAGYTMIMKYPNGFTEGKVITSNTATRLTLASPLAFAYIVGGVSYGQYRIGGVTGASEPNWLGVSVNKYYYDANGISTGAKMTQGSATLDLSSADPVSAGVVGMGVIVSGAGAPDANGNPTDLIATVAAYVDATHVTLSAPAAVTVNYVDVRIDTLVTDGTVQWMLYEYSALAGVARVTNTSVQYGRVDPSASSTVIAGCTFSRADWLYERRLRDGGAGDYERPCMEFDNYVGYGSVFTGPFQSWSESTNSPSQAPARISRLARWNGPVIFPGGQSNNAFNAVGIDRGDGVVANLGTSADIIHNILALIGTLGKHTKSGTNVAGDDLTIQGGLGTGTGGGGKVIVRTQPATSSGSTVPDSVIVGEFDADATAGNSRFLLYDVTAATLKRVKIGAAGTGPGGSGQALYV